MQGKDLQQKATAGRNRQDKLEKRACRNTVCCGTIVQVKKAGIVGCSGWDKFP